MENSVVLLVLLKLCVSWLKDSNTESTWNWFSVYVIICFQSFSSPHVWSCNCNTDWTVHPLPIDLQHSWGHKPGLPICTGLCMGFLFCSIGVFTHTHMLTPHCLNYHSFIIHFGLYKARYSHLLCSGSSSENSWLFWPFALPNNCRTSLSIWTILSLQVCLTSPVFVFGILQSTVICLNTYLCCLVHYVPSIRGFQSFNISGIFCLYTLDKLPFSYWEMLQHVLWEML